jgi:hypothetical protein
LIGMADLLMDVGDEVDVRALELRVGTRVYGAFLAAEDEDVFGVGLGGEAEYFFNRERTLSVKLGLFYSPDIVTFGSANDVKDVSLRLMMRLRDGRDVFAGCAARAIRLMVGASGTNGARVRQRSMWWKLGPNIGAPMPSRRCRQNAFDALEIHRLDQVMIESRFFRTLFVGCLPIAGQRDQRNVPERRLLTNLFRKLIAVYDRQADIKQHDCRKPLECSLHRGRRIVRDPWSMPGQ